MRTAVRSARGRASTGPSGVDVQSIARIIAPSSPPSARKSASKLGGARFVAARGNSELAMDTMKISVPFPPSPFSVQFNTLAQASL
jgi:hypothetical protein